jgi:non-homologous end joining protein Ku
MKNFHAVGGVEVAKDQYLIVEDQEIDAVQIGSTSDQFVSRRQTDDRFIDSPDLAPDSQVGQDAIAVIRFGSNENSSPTDFTALDLRRDERSWYVRSRGAFRDRSHTRADKLAAVES